MLKFRFLILWPLFWGMGLSLWAINLRTTIPDVSHEGSHEIIGICTLDIDGDEFAQASPQNPVYIRFGLQFSKGWSKTLVDLRAGAPEAVNAPINLAIYPGSGFSLNPSIPVTAFQMVRLIRGERHGWLRVTSSSSNWVMEGVGLTSPSPVHKVLVTIGIKGSLSVQSGGSTTSGGNERADSGVLATTLLCADYQNTPNFGAGDLEIIDFLSLDATTQGVEDGDFVFIGSNLAIGFSNDVSIARGADYFPCFEYHFKADDIESAPHGIQVNRSLLVDLHEYWAAVPPVFFTNSSDFEWQAGSRFLLTIPGFDHSRLVAGLSYPGNFWPPFPSTLPRDTDVQIQASNGEVWQVNKIVLEETLIGYELRLSSGNFPVDATIQVSGIGLMAGEEFEDHPLVFDVSGFFVNDVISQGELLQLGPLYRKTAILERGEANLFRMAVPFTAYDRQDWEFLAQVVNPHDEPVKLTALLYNRHGILLRLIREDALAPHASMAVSIRDSFGDLATRVLSWIEFLSDRPLSAVGIIEAQNHDVLDIFPGVDAFQSKLYGAHIPENPAVWQSTAYILSSDPSVDTAFFLKLPGEDASPITSIIFPGGTAVLKDADFEGSAGRSTWLQVDASEPTGAGLLLYSRRDNQPQLASIHMNAAPQKIWAFPHVGNPAGGWWNGLAVLNPNDTPNSIRVRGYDARRNLLATAAVVLPPLSRRVDTLQSLLPFSAANPISQIELEADEGVVSFLFLGQLERSLLTAVPGNLPSSTSLLLPYLPDADKWVGIALINERGVSVNATLTPYMGSGEPGPDVALSIPAGEKALLLLSDYYNQPSQYSHLWINASLELRAYAITGNMDSQLATIAFEAR